MCIIGLLSVQLSENDYAVDEGTSALPVIVTTSGSHDQGLTLQVIPLTFSMYQAQFPDQPCSRSVEVLRDGENDAESESLTLQKSIDHGYTVDSLVDISNIKCKGVSYQ